MNPTTTYTREGNDIFATDTNAETGDKSPAYKVAHIDEEGKLKMGHGMKDAHKEAVQDFLAASGDEIEKPDDGKTPPSNAPVIGDPAAPSDPDGPLDGGTVLDLPPSAFPPLLRDGPPILDATGVTHFGPVPPCPPEDPESGDKTPAVIAWWFKYKPAEAKAKYGHRRFEMPTL